jgi:hypothetical protein
MWVLHPLQHLHLIVDHLLIALYILLKDDLHGNLALGPICLANDAVRACTKGASEAIFVPDVAKFSVGGVRLLETVGILLVIALGLAVHFVHEAGHCRQTLAAADELKSEIAYSSW